MRSLPKKSKTPETLQVEMRTQSERQEFAVKHLYTFSLINPGGMQGYTVHSMNSMFFPYNPYFYYKNNTTKIIWIYLCASHNVIFIHFFRRFLQDIGPGFLLPRFPLFWKPIQQIKRKRGLVSVYLSHTISMFFALS